MADEDVVVLDYYDCLLRKSDISLLRDSHWLNDNIIGFAFEYFERQLFSDYADDVTFVSPQVTQCVKLMSADEAKEMLEPVRIEDKKLVFFAVNDNSSAASVGGSHWSLLLFSKADQACFHYDSMHAGNFEAAKRVYNFLKILTKCPQLKYIEAETPQQHNCCDCGVYLICITEIVCRQRLGLPFNGVAAGELLVDKLVTPRIVSKKRQDLEQLIRSLQGSHPS